MKIKDATDIIGYVEQETLTFSEKPFNQVDSIVLSQFCYVDIPQIMCTMSMLGGSFTFEELFNMNAGNDFVCKKERKKNLQLFEALAKSSRFKDMVLAYQYRFDDIDDEIQFSAMTFQTDDFIYIAYRGTDDSIFGWKEDFNMSFMNTVPSQLLAGEYLLKVATAVPNKELILGGHSKGGNLASFAAMLNLKLLNRIRQIFSHDGPGFRKEVLNSPNYLAIKDKIHKTLPESSVIGKFLLMEEKFSIIKSRGNGVKQHNCLNWYIKDGDFIYCDDFSSSSKLTESSISQWVDEVSDETRKVVVDALFGVVKSTGVEYLYDMPNDLFKNIFTMIKSFKSLQEETKTVITDCMKKLIACTKSNIMVSDKLARILAIFEKKDKNKNDKEQSTPILALEESTESSQSDSIEEILAQNPADVIDPLMPEDYKEPQCTLCDGNDFYNFDADKPMGFVPIQNVISKIDECNNKEDFQEAERLLKYWLEEAVMLKDMRAELSLTNEMLGLSRKLNNEKDGLNAVKRAIELIRFLEVQEDLSSATIYLNAATTLKAFNRPDESIALYENAKKIYDKKLPLDDRLFAALYNNYAAALTDLKRFGKAENYYLKAISILEKYNDYADIAVTCCNLADLYYFAEKEKGSVLIIDSRIQDYLDRAYDLLINSDVERDGYLAFVCRKCAQAFAFHGRFLQKKELNKLADTIYERS